MIEHEHFCLPISVLFTTGPQPDHEYNGCIYVHTFISYSTLYMYSIYIIHDHPQYFVYPDLLIVGYRGSSLNHIVSIICLLTNILSEVQHPNLLS
jgi:hypothetical protein